MSNRQRIALLIVWILAVLNHNGGLPSGAPSPVPSDKLRVLIVHDAGEADELPLSQRQVLRSLKIAQQVQNAGGEYRNLDAEYPPDSLDGTFAEMFARQRPELPWWIVCSPRGGFEAPLPANLDVALATLAKYGGAAQ